jgi:hypothetical protein
MNPPSISDRQSSQQDPVEALQASLESLSTIRVTDKNLQYVKSFESSNQSVTYICKLLIDRKAADIHGSIRLTRDGAIALINQLQIDVPPEIRDEVMCDLYDWLHRLTRTFRLMCIVQARLSSAHTPASPAA